MVYEVETIKQQAKLRSVGWPWVSLWAQAQPMACALRWLGLWHDQRLWSSGCGLRRSTSVICLCLWNI